METPSPFASPWAHDNTPLPSPGPPPSPAVWQPHDWTPGSRKDLPHSRSLPLVPSSNSFPARTNTTSYPLPTHPEFLSNLHSHPLIIQQGDDLRTPSPSSSIELVLHERTDEKSHNNDPVPFPMRSGFTSPVLCASPRPLPSVNGSSQGSAGSVRSVPSSVDSSPAKTPDSAAALSRSIQAPMRSNQVFQPPPPPPLLPQPQPPALSPPQLRLPAQHAPAPSQARQQALGRIHPSHKNAIVAPRPRLPALRGPTGSVGGPRPRSTESTSASRKHSLFYMQEGMVVLKVEGTLYKVHRYLLEHHSDFFRGFLSDDGDAMGHSDGRPIPLPENVTQEAFDCLMSFLYTGIYDPSSVSLPDWITLLRVSTRLQFTKVRQYAIREIATRRSSLAPVDAIVLAKEYDVPSWLGPAYAELVRRPTPMEDEEAERLGARTTAQVGRAREMLRTDEYALYQQRRHSVRYAPPERPDEQLVARAVNEVFMLPNHSNPNPRDGRSLAGAQ